VARAAVSGRVKDDCPKGATIRCIELMVNEIVEDAQDAVLEYFQPELSKLANKSDLVCR